MRFVFVGLGNPGKEYELTRHNSGRIVLEQFRKKNNFSDWQQDKKTKGLVSEGKIKKEKIILLEPEIFMNNSGKSVATVVKNGKAAERAIVIYDDLDLPLGSFKISFDRGSGGHKGLESIIRAIKTRKFVRIRVGISPATPSGKAKKPDSAKINDFIVSPFKEKELEALKKLSKKTTEALEIIVSEGREKAMSIYN